MSAPSVISHRNSANRIAHIAVTFAMALFIFIGVTLIAIARHGFHFFSYFAPKGVPQPIMTAAVRAATPTAA